MRRLPIVVLCALLAGCASAPAATTTTRAPTTMVAPRTSAGATPTTTAAPATTTTGAPTTTAVPRTSTTVASRPLPKVGRTPTGVVVLVTGRSDAGITVTTPCGRPATVPSVQPVGPVQVVLDPGHGGRETGAVATDGLREATVNLAVAEQAEAALHEAGVTVAMTRTADSMMTLVTRGQVVMALRPEAFVSIHHNAEPDGPSDGPGTETYYQIASASSKRLAGLIWEEVHQALAQYQIAWEADADAGAKYRPGSRGDYYAVLRETAGVPAALAELAFISNPAEATLLARPDVQRVEGRAVARGIVRYLTTDDPGSGFVTPYPRLTPAGGGGGQGGCVDPKLS